MLEKYFRSKYERIFVQPLVKKLVNCRFAHPNAITLLAMLIGLCLIPVLYWQWNVLAIILLLLSGYLDTLDGSLARHKGSRSELGSAFDIVADRVVEFSVLLGLYFIDPQQRALPCLVLAGCFYICITVFLVAGIFTPNTGEKSFHYNMGLIERAEVFLFFILMILLPGLFQALAWILVVLLLITVANHAWQFFKYIRCKH